MPRGGVGGSGDRWWVVSVVGVLGRPGHAGGVRGGGRFGVCGRGEVGWEKVVRVGGGMSGGGGGGGGERSQHRC